MVNLLTLLQFDALWVLNIPCVLQASGTYIESFTSRHLQPNGDDMVDGEQEDIIKWCAGGLYAGAADTVSHISPRPFIIHPSWRYQTVSALLSFIRLMALHPSVQTTAQEELDTVIGRRQVPSPAELGRLSYLAAVLKEVLRYAPVGNLGTSPRCSKREPKRNYFPF